MLIFSSLEHGSEQIEIRKWLYFLILRRTTVSIGAIALHSNRAPWLLPGPGSIWLHCLTLSAVLYTSTTFAFGIQCSVTTNFDHRFFWKLKTAKYSGQCYHFATTEFPLFILIFSFLVQNFLHKYLDFLQNFIQKYHKIKHDCVAKINEELVCYIWSSQGVVLGSWNKTVSQSLVISAD